MPTTDAARGRMAQPTTRGGARRRLPVFGLAAAILVAAPVAGCRSDGKTAPATTTSTTAPAPAPAGTGPATTTPTFEIPALPGVGDYSPFGQRAPR